MIHLPRLALATPGSGPEPALASLALLAGLTERRWRVQHFRSRACPTVTEAVEQVTGLPGRHLDAWLMPGAMCRTLFARRARSADLAVVEGTLDEPGAPLDCASYQARPGRLRRIAEALDLPIVGLVTCRDRDDFHLPRLAEGVDAVLLDELEDPGDFEWFRRMFTLTLKKPVLGAVEALPRVRQAVRHAPQDRPLPEELFAPLAASFVRFADLGAIRALAQSRPFGAAVDEPDPGGRPRFRVAYAQDEAFGAYFPDTLETLQALGAELVEFSPMGDESLPEAVDLVMIGCGFPDRHADALAENLSLIGALQSHVCRGQRIYTEGGGTAYLGQSLILGDRQVPGAGILPFHAVLQPDPAPPTPVARTLTRDGWLGPRGTTVRGYRSGRWRLVPGADPLDCPACFGPLTAQGDIYFHHHAVGSLIHLYLGALPEVVAAFAGPHRPSLTLPSART
jgi:cobyrinic acid a,c-diamide synthase